MSSMASVVLETIQVLVALATDLTTVRLILFHAGSVKVRSVGFRVDDGKRSVVVLLECLVLVAMKTMVLETILVLVCLFAANHRTLERLVLFILHHVQVASWVVNVHAIGVGICNRLVDSVRREMSLLLVYMLLLRSTIARRQHGPWNGALAYGLVLEVEMICREMQRALGLLLLLLLLLRSLVMVVVQEHICGQHGLHDIMDVVNIVSIAVGRKDMRVGFLRRRRQNVGLLVVSKQVV